MPTLNTMLVSSPWKVSEEVNLKAKRGNFVHSLGGVIHSCLAPLLGVCWGRITWKEACSEAKVAHLMVARKLGDRATRACQDKICPMTIKPHPAYSLHPSFHHLPIMLSGYKSINGSIHWWDSIHMIQSILKFISCQPSLRFLSLCRYITSKPEQSLL